MKYKVMSFAIILVTIALVLFSGCSSSDQTEINNLKSENASLSLKLNGLTQEYQDLQQAHQSLQSEYNDLTTKYSSLQDENNVLAAKNNQVTTDLNSAQQQLSSTAIQTASLQDKIAALQTSYNSLQNDLQSSKDQLNKVNSVYPPKNFTSKDELTAWLTANTISGYNTDDPVAVYQAAYDLQQKASADGYAINLDVSRYGTTSGATTFYFNVYCTAQVQNTLYYWDIRYGNVDVLISDVTNFKWATAP